jgi:hypothetical protein
MSLEQKSKLEMRRKERKLAQAINRAKTKLKDEGIQARKNEKARLARLKDYAARNEQPLEEDLHRIREPDHLQICSKREIGWLAIC